MKIGFEFLLEIGVLFCIYGFLLVFGDYKLLVSS